MARARHATMTTPEHYNPYKWPMILTVYGAMFVAVIMLLVVAIM